MAQRNKTRAQLLAELDSLRRQNTELACRLERTVAAEGDPALELVVRIARGVVAKTGDHFFNSLVTELAAVLQADFAFAGELHPHKAGVVRSISAVSAGATAPPFEYGLRGTPCEDILAQGVCSIPNGVRKLFPADQLLKDMGIEAYAGAPLRDVRGMLRGILVVLFRRRLEIPQLAAALLEIFAARAAAELDRRRNARHLAESEARFRRLVDNLPGVVYRCSLDVERSELFYSAAIVELTGYPADDFGQAQGGRRYFGMIHPDDQELVQRRIFEEVEQGRPFSLEYRIRHVDGSQRWVYEKGQASFDQEGRLSCLDGAMFDITERKTAEQQLQEREQQYYRLFEQSHSVMLLIDPDSARIIDANAAASRFYGFSKHQLCSRKISEINTLSEAEVFAEMSRARREQRNYFEFCHRLADGSLRDVEVFSGPIQVGGRQLLCSIVHDITERKRAEQTLREVDRIKDEFISTAAHELRTPLASVMGYTEILLTPEAFGGFPESEQKEFLTEIYEKGELLSRIVDDLLDISRIESGRELPLETGDCDLAALLEKVLRQFRMTSPGRRFELELREPPPAMLRCDRGKLLQVLENLLGNAVKYSPPDSPVWMNGWREADEYCVAVRDAGIGMTVEQRERVFDKFYRVDGSDRAVRGLGLGLSIVRQIVMQHGGRIWIDSEPGQGTSVVFTLPVQGEGGGY